MFCLFISLVPFSSSDEPPVVEVDRVSPDPENRPIDNDPVLRGGTARLRCVPTVGTPTPTLQWGQARPAGSVVTNDVISGATFITVSNIQAGFCVDCVGQSAAGQHTDRQCIIVRKWPHACRSDI